MSLRSWSKSFVENLEDSVETGEVNGVSQIDTASGDISGLEKYLRLRQLMPTS
jgi:hypothetical protein